MGAGVLKMPKLLFFFLSKYTLLKKKYDSQIIVSKFDKLHFLSFVFCYVVVKLELNHVVGPK